MPAVSRMSLTARRTPSGGSSTLVIKTRSSSSATSVRALEPCASQLTFDHLREQLLDLAISRDLDVSVVVRILPVDERAALGELVELGARYLELEPGVLGLTLGDDRPGQAHAEYLDVAPAAKLQANRQLEVAERGNFAREPLVGARDQLLGARHLRLVPLEELLADHHLLDLGCALADQEQRRVAIYALDLVLLRVAVAAVDAQRLLGVGPGRLGREELRHSGLEVRPPPRALHARRLEGQEARRLEPRAHLRELEGDRLVLRDGLAEGLALLAGAEGQLHGALGSAHPARGHVPTADPARVHHLDEALAE